MSFYGVFEKKTEEEVRANGIKDREFCEWGLERKDGILDWLYWDYHVRTFSPWYEVIAFVSIFTKLIMCWIWLEVRRCWINHPVKPIHSYHSGSSWDYFDHQKPPLHIAPCSSGTSHQAWSDIAMHDTILFFKLFPTFSVLSSSKWGVVVWSSLLQWQNQAFYTIKV
jgi:hypothetical protein